MDTTLAPPSPPAAPTARRPVTRWEELEKIGEAIVLFAVYLVIARGDIAFHVDGHRLDIALDRELPFSPPWVFVYVTFYLFAFSPLLYTRRAPWFRRVFAAMGVTMAVTYVVFLVFPTREVLRPTLDGATGFTMWFLRLVYGGDGGYNCFPSMHVGLSHLAAWTLRDVDRKVAPWAWALAILISVSTLLLKEHYLVDVVAGALLAFAAHRLALGRFARRHPAEADDHRGRWVLVGLVGLQALATLGIFIAYRTTVK
jgi:membrane-associated phospholipid phosphatase